MLIVFKKLARFVDSLSQYLRQILTHLRRHHENHAVVAILAERQTQIIRLEIRFPAVSLPANEVKRAIAQHLAIAHAMKWRYKSYTRIVRHHLNIIHTHLCLADGHLGAQRNSFILHIC